MKNAQAGNSVLHRIKIIEGHVRKIRAMVEEGEYCPKILLQSLAVQEALKRVDELILNSHLRSCTTEALKGDRENQEKAIGEIVEIFKRVRR